MFCPWTGHRSFCGTAVHESAISAASQIGLSDRATLSHTQNTVSGLLEARPDTRTCALWETNHLILGSQVREAQAALVYPFEPTNNHPRCGLAGKYPPGARMLCREWELNSQASNPKFHTLATELQGTGESMWTSPKHWCACHWIPVVCQEMRKWRCH